MKTSAYYFGMADTYLTIACAPRSFADSIASVDFEDDYSYDFECLDCTCLNCRHNTNNN